MEYKTRANDWNTKTSSSSHDSTRGNSLSSFQFSPENKEKIAVHIAKYPQGRHASAILPILDIAQRQNGGWISQPILEEVATLLEMPCIRVHEVASFYSMFNLNPVGKYHIQVCGTTPCWLRGAQNIKEACQRKLGIGEGEVTLDGQFSLIEVECLGACVNAPMVQINDDYFEDLTPESLEMIIDHLAQGKKIGEDISPGPQIKRQFAAPVGHDPMEPECIPIKKQKKAAKKQVTDAE